MKDITENILERLMSVTGIKNLAQLAGILGISPTSVYEARNKNKIPDNWIRKIAEKYGTSTDYLYYGDGIPEKNTVHAVDFTYINVVQAKVSAGIGSLETGDNSTDIRAFRTDWITKKGSPRNMVLMEVSGDSMYPEIYNKDLVLIDQSKKDIFASQIYAVGFEDSIYIKRIEKEPNKIILVSTNKEYRPIEIVTNEYTEDQFRIIGKVLWVGREY